MADLTRTLDRCDPNDLDFMHGIQGNILKAHGRNYAAHVFMTFTEDAPAAREWLGRFGRTEVISARQQEIDTRAWAAAGRQGPGAPFAALVLSHAGYRALGVPDADVPSDHDFRHGMKRRRHLVPEGDNPLRNHDPPVDAWEEPYRGTAHAMVLLADDSSGRLAERVQQIERTLRSSIAATLWIEHGAKLREKFPSGEFEVEHFGYRDGISDPRFFEGDIERERATRGSDRWDPAAPLGLVLAREAGVTERFGSYLVFRKLEQNVRGFKAALERLADQLGLQGEARERAGAMAVGRFRDGTPLMETSRQSPEANDFHYSDDRTGAVCPLHAHIRKTNPRGDGMNLPFIPGVPDPKDTPEEERRAKVEAFERAHRVARRAIPYGRRPDREAGSGLPFPDRGVGLLFMSYQARVEQFIIQQQGADSNHFSKPELGVDAVLGSNDAPVAQQWTVGARTTRFAMANFVRLMGGEFFYAPSMAFLRELA